MGKSNIEVFYRPNAEFTFKVEAGGLEEVFQTLGPVQEIMDVCNKGCGKCGSKKVRLLHRETTEGHDVYELMCMGEIESTGKKFPCKAKLALGKGSDGNLFPRRYDQEYDEKAKKWTKKKDADGKVVWLPHEGWMRWDGRLNDGKGGNV